MDLVAYALDKVLVRNATILIFIEEIEHDFRLGLCHGETPMLEKEDQFLLVDKRVIVRIEVFESFAHGAPLLPDFGDQSI